MTTAAASPRPEAATTPRQRLMITLTMMLATLLHVIDATIANVALPQMQGTLLATHDQISWVLTSYIVTSAIMTPLAGWLSGRLGRRRLLLGAVFGFTVTSMMCGAAATLEQMVLFRALQGAFGAVLVPLSQAILLDTYPPKDHGFVMSMWGVAVMVGPIMGPTLGGLLTEELTWRWVFYINLPVGIVCAIGILLLIHDDERRERPFDVTGFALLAIAIGAAQLTLDRGQLLDWFESVEIVVETVVAALAFTMFLIHASTTGHPFVDLRLFEDRNVSVGLMFAALASMVMIATAALMPPFLQGLRGYPAITVGLVLAPRGLGTMVSMLIFARIAGMFDGRIVVAIGFAITALSVWLMTGFTLEVSVSEVVWTGVLQGFGLGFVWPPLSTIMFATLPPARRTEVASFNALARNLGGSVGIAVLVALLTQNTQIARAELAPSISPFNPAWAAVVGAGGQGASTLALWDAELTRQAGLIAYLNDFHVLTWLIVASIPLLVLLKPAPRPR
ncbi:MAG: DHA2 family efflux MFS transporter permease subunit [Rhodospirillales bacterium]|nr:DHA2 family efflux MFS transporter permease subunit [Rhodospirillales bacterium]QQS13871.1 MAG: DHA2 family efflux MFS transporter permease subunit [Rhodospirillales bacterium]